MGYILYEKKTTRRGVQYVRVGFVSVGNAVFFDSDRFTVQSFLQLEEIVDEGGRKVESRHLMYLIHLTKAVGTSGGRTFEKPGVLNRWINTQPYIECEN